MLHSKFINENIGPEKFRKFVLKKVEGGIIRIKAVHRWRNKYFTQLFLSSEIKIFLRNYFYDVSIFQHFISH